MKKLVAITMAVLATAGVAMAIPSFTLPAELTVMPGDSVAITVGSADGAVQGVTLYLAVDAPLDLDNLVVDGAGMVFAGNIAGGVPYIEKLDTGLLYADFATNVGTATLGGTVATATLIIPVDAPMGDYRLTTNLELLDPVSYEGVYSTWAGVDAGQATTIVHVIPEPATALLLLVAVPFLRRRHA